MNNFYGRFSDEELWEWEEAFDKFGFNDGDDPVQTGLVADALELAGYAVEVTPWGIHNTVITSISKGGIELMPVGANGHRIGYDNPRTYLPEELVKLLDGRFSN
tara:strand:- start:9062 stop:9373 length:312 start_codon:yes stop_codon:yes gene_type:complete